MIKMGSGEAMEQARRKRFWTIVAALCLTGLVVGGVAGFLMVKGPDGQRLFTLAPWLVWTLILLANAAFLYGCWIFYRSIDEVELVDNLWGSTVGFYAYVMLFMSWTGLSIAGVTRAPNHFHILVASLIAATAAYLWRKWRAR